MREKDVYIERGEGQRERMTEKDIYREMRGREGGREGGERKEGQK